MTMSTQNAAAAVAENDYELHLKYGVDLNPYSTEGARNEWQRGYDSLEPRPFEGPVVSNFRYLRGQAARALKDAETTTKEPS
jgi:hypothetical protein